MNGDPRREATSEPNPANLQSSLRIQPPYGIILDELRSGKAIPFLGAAASRVGYIAGDKTYLPSGCDLSELLATDAQFPSAEERDRSDLAKVSSYYVEGSNRDALRRRLRRVFVSKT